ncbi:rod shape-determining protein MreC [Algoriphagus sp. CAU 1675]|uniref:rod shape-determining protein MreC n=1 Tax=Algoriphagus sp. CAU 1675 TaxID=3032597 RepID=UPI0023DCCE51|nr:rod shape-determining protein MreC [Algoriphagus sp. CAU 1675]MDF2158928.1 rod shape-determining protein MreC [Algoriphagus sp. CAU 1675]
MLRILQFLYSLRAFLLFVILEVIAIWLIVSNNSPQGAAFFNSSNALSGSVLNTQSEVLGFFSLGEMNEKLLDQNTALMTQLELLNPATDSINLKLDSALEASLEFKGARVISQTLRFAQNHLTINKGEKDGVKVGMGIFNQEGVVGRIKSVSKNYAVGISLLNTELLVSSKIKSSDVYGSINWDGNDSKYAKLLYVPRHVQAQVGDTIVTSGYNAIFPEGIHIGIIQDIERRDDQNYLNITVELTTDFSRVNYVYLVENLAFEELDSLYNNAEVNNEY